MDQTERRARDIVRVVNVMETTVIVAAAAVRAVATDVNVNEIVLAMVVGILARRAEMMVVLLA